MPKINVSGIEVEYSAKPESNTMSSVRAQVNEDNARYEKNRSASIERENQPREFGQDANITIPHNNNRAGNFEASGRGEWMALAILIIIFFAGFLIVLSTATPPV